MACQDFPCCGHEAGCCPRFDASGKQLDMVCTCGARLPVDNGYSLCHHCLKTGMEEVYGYDREDYIGELEEAYPSDTDTPLYEDYYGGA